MIIKRIRPRITFGPNSNVEISYVSFQGFDTVFNGSAQQLHVNGSSFLECEQIADMDNVEDFSFTNNIEVRPTRLPCNRKERRAAAKTYGKK